MMLLIMWFWPIVSDRESFGFSTFFFSIVMFYVYNNRVSHQHVLTLPVFFVITVLFLTITFFLSLHYAHGFITTMFQWYCDHHSNTSLHLLTLSTLQPLSHYYVMSNSNLFCIVTSFHITAIHCLTKMSSPSTLQTISHHNVQMGIFPKPGGVR